MGIPPPTHRWRACSGPLTGREPGAHHAEEEDGDPGTCADRSGDEAQATGPAPGKQERTATVPTGIHGLRIPRAKCAIGNHGHNGPDQGTGHDPPVVGPTGPDENDGLPQTGGDSRDGERGALSAILDQSDSDHPGGQRAVAGGDERSVPTPSDQGEDGSSGQFHQRIARRDRLAAGPAPAPKERPRNDRHVLPPLQLAPAGGAERAGSGNGEAQRSPVDHDVQERSDEQPHHSGQGNRHRQQREAVRTHVAHSTAHGRPRSAGGWAVAGGNRGRTVLTREYLATRPGEALVRSAESPEPPRRPPAWMPTRAAGRLSYAPFRWDPWSKGVVGNLGAPSHGTWGNDGRGRCNGCRRR